MNEKKEVLDMFICIPFVGFAINLLIILALIEESNYKNWTLLTFVVIYFIIYILFNIIPFLYYYFIANGISCNYTCCSTIYGIMCNCESLIFWRKNRIEFTLIGNDYMEAIPFENDFEIIPLEEDIKIISIEENIKND
jgi:hypothetical protein